MAALPANKDFCSPESFVALKALDASEEVHGGVAAGILTHSLPSFPGKG